MRRRTDILERKQKILQWISEELPNAEIARRLSCKVDTLKSYYKKMGQSIPLELHHIDFNHYNNSLDNLQILCSNCHMQVHGYNNNLSAPGETQDVEVG